MYSRHVYAHLLQALFRSLILSGLLGVPASVPKALLVDHRADLPDRRRLGALTRAIGVHPLDDHVLLLKALVEQREVPDAGREPRRRSGGAAVQARRLRFGFWGEPVLDAHLAVGIGDDGAEERIEPPLDDLETPVFVQAADVCLRIGIKINEREFPRAMKSYFEYVGWRRSCCGYKINTGLRS